MRRTPVLWILFATLGLGGLVTAVAWLPEALNLVRDEITMDREAALAAAEVLADRNGWSPGPDGRRTAASYGEEDPGVRSFVELEQGGPDAYRRIVEEGLYVPSRWTVRLFVPDSIPEAWVEFTPDGSPLGFGLTLSDDDPGSDNLDGVAAEALAESTAAEWGVDLGDFELVARSTDEAPSGRVDHAFVFRRLGVDLGDGEVRLRVRIAGDRPAGVYHYVEVPESFRLRYQELRTANDGIAMAASALFLVLFVIVGGGGGILVLARRGGLLLRPALVSGGIVGLAMALNGVNTIPLAWMEYDTAVDEGMFLAQLVGSALLLGAVAGSLLGVLYMAAESMGRAAFPGHLRQWRFWSRDVARSDPALGVTLTGYLLAGLHLGYVTLFMMATSRLEGWWSPASNVIQPDLVATYQPWLLAVATNLLAATWEESVFRAIPLAGAALLAARFGRRGLWIGAALLLQAVIFAAGHANYPQQPSYARVVELIPPALMWGAVYLRLGLVPTIVAHFLYNLYLTSLPLFQMAAPGIGLDRALTMGVAAVPLLVVLGARLRFGATGEAPAEARNGAWRPDEPGGGADEAREVVPPESEGGAVAALPPLRVPLPPRLVLPLGLVLLVGAWAVAREDRLPPASATRAQAVEVAAAEMRARGFDPGDWRVLADFTADGGPAHRWVFEELGPEVYDRLLGPWLAGPRWQVRFVDFERPAAERAEEFTVVVGGTGAVLAFRHTLPEGRDGAALDEAEARVLAVAHLDEDLGLDPSDVDEVSAERIARPARRDWEFGFRGFGVLPDSVGEARLTVTLAGDEIVGVRRRVEPPEAWVREQESEASRSVAMVVPALLLILGGGGFILVVGVRLWSRGELNVGFLLGVGGVALVPMVVGWLNGIPEVVAGFDPTLGWPLQFGGTMFAGLLLSGSVAGAVGLSAAVARRWLPRRDWRGAPVGVGVLLVGLLRMVSATSSRFLGEASPPARAFDGIDHAWPAASPLVGSVLQFVVATVALLLLGAAYRRAGRSAAVRMALQAGLGLAVATAVAVSWPEGPAAAGAAAVIALAALVLFGLFVSKVPRVAVEAAGVVTLLGLVEAVVDPSFTGHALGAGLGVVVVAALLAVVWRRLGAYGGF